MRMAMLGSGALYVLALLAWAAAAVVRRRERRAA
jgi:hypothetical protein